MKKFLLTVLSIVSLTVVSQPSIQLTDYIAATPIAPNSTVNLNTTPNGNVNITIDVKNTSASTKFYKAKRYDILLNSAGSTTASAYFCFAGNCYGASTFTSPSVLSLNSNQSASQSTVAYNMLVADLDEASSVGVSVVKYTFFNTTLASDSVQITLKYNAPVGLNENTNASISSFEAYPNPASDFTSFKINSTRNSDAKLEVYNSLGGMVSTKNVQLSEGKNKIDYNVENLSPGIYFASVKLGNSTYTKKFIVK